MYLPDQFAMSDEATDELLGKGGFGHLVTPNSEGLEVTSLPWLFDAKNRSLVGHVSRPNPHWQLTQDTESVVIIPNVDAYVTPEYYPSKYETHKVVPTWNYEILHVFGRLEAHDDREWLLDQVTRLTQSHEAGREKEWSVDEAPARFIDMQLRGIVGIELKITRVIAKAKLNQNRSQEDRSGVIRGLEQGTLTERATAAHMVASGLDHTPN